MQIFHFLTKAPWGSVVYTAEVISVQACNSTLQQREIYFISLGLSLLIQSRSELNESYFTEHMRGRKIPTLRGCHLFFKWTTLYVRGLTACNWQLHYPRLSARPLKVCFPRLFQIFSAVRAVICMHPQLYTYSWMALISSHTDDAQLSSSHQRKHCRDIIQNVKREKRVDIRALCWSNNEICPAPRQLFWFFLWLVDLSVISLQRFFTDNTFK